MIRLFTSSYDDVQAGRNSELRECLERNVACAAIDEILVLAEKRHGHIPRSEKIRIRPIALRPCYDDFFRWINEIAGPEDISIIANPDIFFDASARVLQTRNPRRDEVFALSRWDLLARGESRLYDHNDSQDTWIVRGKVNHVGGDFPIGVPRCDNRVASEFEKAGYRVLNPSFSIRSFHLHAGNRVPYATNCRPDFVAPPYKYVWPHNLAGLPATAWHNLLHPSYRLGWRVDRRLWTRRLKLRGFRALKELAAAIAMTKRPRG